MRVPSRGLTLVEVMVALVLFAVGALAMARAADLSGRAFARARRFEAVVAVARATLDSLRWRSCDGTGPAAGAASIEIGGARVGTQAWQVAPSPRGFRHLTDSVVAEPNDGRPAWRFALEGAAVCP